MTYDYLNEHRLLAALRSLPEDPEIHSLHSDTSTTSPANLQLASIWLQNCLQTHGLCQSSQEQGNLPSQILNITDPKCPYLESGAGKREQYVTLSYKWGSSKRYMTTTLNLSLHAKGIPILELPGTFRDAINVAHALGFHYLWIDALCIVQDLEEVKQREMDHMSDIFSQSTLTILAAAGENADAGFSVRRDPRFTKPCILTVQSTDDTTQEETICLVAGDNEAPRLTGEPLFTRGWVLQEQLLSIRELIFGSAQMSWQCLCQSSTETNPWYNDGFIGNFDDKRQQLLGTSALQYPGLDGLNDVRRVLRRPSSMDQTEPSSDHEAAHWRARQAIKWNTVISDYTRRELTFSSDVLLALGGLAEAMASRYECVYRAGLWEDDLQNGLLWYLAARGPYKGRSELNVIKLPDTPSWSWVGYWGHHIDFLQRKQTYEPWLARYEVRCAPSSAMTQGVRTRNPFTSIGNKTLTLTGRMRAVCLDPKTWAVSEPTKSEPTLSQVLGYMIPDSNLNEEWPATIYCLLCRLRDVDSGARWQLACLGLIATDRDNEFQRVGIVILERNNYFGHIYVGCSGQCHYPRHNHSEDTKYLRTIYVI